MPRTIERPSMELAREPRVRPSIVDPATAAPFTLEQELEPFGAWAGSPIWVPPKDASRELAETMLRSTRPFASRGDRWAAVLRKHRNEFTQVRELELFEASIRLPKGKFYVTITEREDFDKITDEIPRCVQTRLDEFMEGPGKKPGVKVYYLKPLCVEIGDSLSFTTHDDLMAAIAKVHEEVFATYRRLALYRRPWQAMVGALNIGLAAPRAFMKHVVARRRKAIEAYHARLEFERRKLALEVARIDDSDRSERRDRAILHGAGTVAGGARATLLFGRRCASVVRRVIAGRFVCVGAGDDAALDAAGGGLRPRVRRRNAGGTRSAAKDRAFRRSGRRDACRDLALGPLRGVV
jgi:hypothetical protein